MINQIECIEQANKIKELINKSKFLEATPLIEALIKEIPNQQILYQWYAICQIHQHNYNLALEALEKSIPINSNDVEIWHLIGVVQERLQNINKSLEAFHLASKLDPDNPNHLKMIANLHEQNNNLEEAEKYILLAITKSPKNLSLKTTLAKIYTRKKLYPQAIELYKSLEVHSLAKESRDEIFFSLGKIYDTLNNPKEAFKYFSKGNTIARKKYLAMDCDKDKEWELLKVYKKRIQKYQIPQPPHPPMAFLVGFPRSGTTLLERILDTHHSIQVLDEKSTFLKILSYFSNTQNMKKFFKESFRFRLEYFAEVLDNIEYYPDKLLIDKNPLYLRDVGLIHYLFPHAKFIFALRHPCDVCLSCFMQNFATTPSLANFTSIEDSVSYYDETMKLFLQQVEEYHLEVHRIRYEDLTNDFQGEAKKLLNFLDMPWQENLDQYYKHVKDKVLVRTPSYSQVCKPIYKDARFRWLKYKNYFQTYLPVLEPYIQKFGYENGI